MMLKVGIIGLGYLGQPLAQKLMHTGNQVIASKASMKQGIFIDEIKVVPLNLSKPPFRLPEESVWLFAVDALICTIPPSCSLEYAAAIDYLLSQALSYQVRRFILLSSISVYGEAPRLCDEQSVLQPVTESAKSMVEAEQSLLKSGLHETVILRLGGLYSDARHPVKHLSAKIDIKKGQHGVNLLHQDDAVCAIVAALQKTETGVFNVCADTHPKRSTFYTHEAKRLNLPLPEFDPADLSEGKIVENTKFKQVFDFAFQHELT